MAEGYSAKSSVQLPEGLMTYFQKEVTRARALRENYLAEWQVEDNLKRYDPASKTAEGVNVAVDFRDVERKKASLFYDLPAISLRPSGEGNAQAAVLHQELLNGLLSDLKMQAKATALQCVQDCLVAIQPATTKIGYLPTIETVQAPVTDPMGMPVLDETGQPQMQDVPVTVHDEFFWSRISNRALLLPCDFKETVYDRAPWIGYEWKKSKSQVIREYDLPEDWEIPSGNAPHPLTYTDDREPEHASDPKVAGVTIYYKAALLDPSVRHPELQRCLVLLEGSTEPLKHEIAPYQTLQEDGRLTPDSLIGYPLHPLALRDRPDSAWVPADSSQTGPLTKELNIYLKQSRVQRDGNRLVLLADIGKIDTQGIEAVKGIKAVESLDLSIVPVRDGALVQGAGAVMAQVPTLQQGRETFIGRDIMERYRDQILGISENQAGVGANRQKTATEQSIIQRNTEARFEQERVRVLAWWLAGVRKLSALVVRYGDRQAVDILGPQRAQMWTQFKDQGLLTAFQFEVAIDSGQYQDIEARRRQTLQVFNFLAKSPFVNQQKLHEKIFADFGWDPAEMSAQPQPPKPEPPKLSFTFKGEDLIGPQAPIVLDILQKSGFPVDPAAVQNALRALGLLPQGANGQAEPPGQGLPTPQTVPSAALPAPRLDQHQLDLTGRLPGPGPN